MKSKFGTHEDTCEMRPKFCEFCDLQFRIEVYIDHVEKCGSRTYMCEECKRYIRFKDKLQHKSSTLCTKFQEETRQKELLEKEKRMEDLR